MDYGTNIFFVGVDKSVSKNEKKTKKNWKEFLRNFFFSASSLLRSDVFEQDAKTFCSCEHLILTFVFHLCQSAAKKKLIIRQKRKIWKKKGQKIMIYSDSWKYKYFFPGCSFYYFLDFLMFSSKKSFCVDLTDRLENGLSRK